MSSNHAPCGQFPDGFCKVIIGFISLSYHLINHQIDITSRHFAVAFEIPIHNISIYFDKLFSVRCLLLFVSELFENCIFQVAGGDRNPERSMKVRKYVGTSAFGVLLAIRIIYLFLLYKSRNLSFQIYYILSFESFPYGIFDNSFMPLASEYVSVVSALFNFGRLFVLGVQFVLDLMWYSRPLLMIKIQAWICVILTFIAVGLWYYYNLYIQIGHGRSPEKVLEILRQPGESVFDKLFDPFSPDYYDELAKRRNEAKEKLTELEQVIEKAKEEHSPEDNGNSDKGSESSELGAKETENKRTPGQIFCDSRIGKDGIGAAISPILMYWFSSFYRDFLYPATLPYGLLQRDKCHMINMLAPVAILVGPLVLFILDNFTHFLACWSWVYDIFWFLYVPVPIIFTFALLAIHTHIPSARAIINSRPRVMAMTLMLMLSFGFLETISWIGLGKYASRDNPGGYTLMGFHINASFLCRSIFSRVSVGYSDTRISLGYHLPKFRPNHKMSRSNLRWYLFKQTFKRAWADAKGDFRLDIKKYL